MKPQMDVDGSLERAEAFLAELEEDRRAAPPEFQPLLETYLPRLGESIARFREGRLGARELNAHVLQIRMSYARDLQRQLPGEAPSTARFVRN